MWSERVSERSDLVDCTIISGVSPAEEWVVQRFWERIVRDVEPPTDLATSVRLSWLGCGTPALLPDGLSLKSLGMVQKGQLQGQRG